MRRHSVPKISKSITINVPVEKVFSYMAILTNLPEIWPNLKTMREVRCHVGIVAGYEWKYIMTGMPFGGEAKISESIPNRRLVIKNKEGIPCTFVLTYQPIDGSTNLSVEVEYSVPNELLKEYDEPFVASLIEYEAEDVLTNLKAKMEA
jgi:uncharacterized membrane protein